MGDRRSRSGCAAAALGAPFALGASHQRAKYQPHGENRAEDIANAIEKEQAALDWLDRTPPHFGDSYRRLKEAVQSLDYATQYLSYVRAPRTRGRRKAARSATRPRPRRRRPRSASPAASSLSAR